MIGKFGVEDFRTLALAIVEDVMKEKSKSKRFWICHEYFGL